jgi:hypothetical protein
METINNKKFADIKADICATSIPVKSLIERIPDNYPICEVSYRHGDLIGSHKGFEHINDLGNNPIGIVVHGKAELIETYIADGYIIYRPIRIIKPGDLLLDFRAIDRICCDDNAHSISGLGETWMVYAGFISTIIKQRVDPITIIKNSDLAKKLNVSLDTRFPHAIFSHINCETKIIFMSSDIIKHDREIIFNLLLYFWPRTKIYRDCLNSFNFSLLSKFRISARSVVQKIETKYRMTGVTKLTVMQYVIDAIWDGYNRPIRREPIFSGLPSDILGEVSASVNTAVNTSNILVATDDISRDELWFPIDLNNYLVASSFDGRALDEHEREFTKKDHSNAIKNLSAKTLTNSRLFYKSLCDDLTA